MRFTSIAGINRPVSRVVLGTEDYYLDQFDHHARILDAWISGGGNAIDTARMYATRDGVPNSELVVGKWMVERANRSQITVITKGAHSRAGDNSGLGWVSSEVIDGDVANSLEALGSDYIDIWLFHRDNPKVEVAPIMTASIPTSPLARSARLAPPTGPSTVSRKPTATRPTMGYRAFRCFRITSAWRRSSPRAGRVA